MLYSEIQTSRRIMATLKLVLTLIALVTLAMAGVTITNTMLAAVMERFYEIGLRRAIGAKRKDVMSQFLTEAAAIGFVGGFGGVIFSVIVYSVSLIWLRYTDIAFLTYVVVSLLVSGVTGFLAGIYPAYQASRLNPIEALNRTFH
jgi:putative ABC transport system permease protein